MDFYLNAPAWDYEKCPHVCENAVPVKTQSISNVSVIKIKNASYRNAKFDGTFVIVNGSGIKEARNGLGKKKVFCLWFGHRLAADYPELTFNIKDAEVIEGYRGKVVVDISEIS